MKMRLYLYILLFVTMAIVACSDTAPDTTCKGIGSVEMNDTLIAIHYYDNVYVISDEYRNNLCDSARVKFKINIGKRIVDTAYVYQAEVVELSGDIRRQIVFRAHNKQADTALCVPTDMHITRDFRRLDFFNISTRYVTCDNNADEVSLVLDSAEQEASTDSLVVLWLRHSQVRTDSADRVEYNTISVPLNILIPADTLRTERLYLKVKMFGSDGDTVVNNYVYSYMNYEK